MTAPGLPRCLTVRAPSRATEVVVGPGALEGLASRARAALPAARRWLFVVDAGVAAPGVAAAWGAGWVPPDGAFVAPAGEAAKTREVHALIEDAILDAGLARDDGVVAVGGGAVLDVAGYAAATARRGIPWVAVPTSVVAMADAAVGGKTAVNHPRGKNLLGTFHPPALVVADPRALATLPARDRAAGLAEVWKSGVVGDAALARKLAEEGPPAGEDAWTDALFRSVAVKARLVEQDERDGGVRRLLNYGHTVGHALETTLGNDGVRHGEGIAVGMGVAAELARARGRVDEAWVAAQDRALVRLGLPVRVPRAAGGVRLLQVMAEDKKRRADAPLVFVLPGPAGLEVVDDLRPEEVVAAIAARRA